MFQNCFFRKSSLKVSAVLLALIGSAGSSSAQQVQEFWHYLGAGGELDAVKAMMAVAEKQMPGQMTHRPIPGGSAGLRQQVQVSLMGGVPPAVYQLSAGLELYQLAESGRLAPLNDAWTAVNGDNIFPEGLMRVVSFGKDHYGIPFSMSILGNAFYNKAIFSKLGLTPPKTWDEFDAVAKKLKENGYQVLTSASGPAWTTYQTYGPILSAIGVDGYWELARGKLSLTGPEMTKAFDLFEKHIVANLDSTWTGSKWADGLDRVMKGEIAMYIIGDWGSGYMKQRGWEPGKDYDLFPVPGTLKTTIFQADVVSALKGDKVPVAGNFAKVVGSSEAQVAFSQKKGSLAARNDVPGDIYDVVSKVEFDKMADKSNQVVPNVYVLLPSGFREDFGTAIEKFAATKDRKTFNAELAKLDNDRVKLLEAGSFGKW
jgi:ABC-type glycerol-3-phosphate transport system substrate-binding protein